MLLNSKRESDSILTDNPEKAIFTLGHCLPPLAHTQAPRIGTEAKNPMHIVLLLFYKKKNKTIFNVYIVSLVCNSSWRAGVPKIYHMGQIQPAEPFHQTHVTDRRAGNSGAHGGRGKGMTALPLGPQVQRPLGIRVGGRGRMIMC